MVCIQCLYRSYVKRYKRRIAHAASITLCDQITLPIVWQVNFFPDNKYEYKIMSFLYFFYMLNFSFNRTLLSALHFMWHIYLWSRRCYIEEDTGMGETLHWLIFNLIEHKLKWKHYQIKNMKNKIFCLYNRNITKVVAIHFDICIAISVACLK